jgi:hypothetical protein
MLQQTRMPRGNEVYVERSTFGKKKALFQGTKIFVEHICNPSDLRSATERAFTLPITTTASYGACPLACIPQHRHSDPRSSHARACHPLHAVRARHGRGWQADWKRGRQSSRSDGRFEPAARARDTSQRKLGMNMCTGTAPSEALPKR